MPMTADEIDAFLAEPRLAHLATVDASGRPRVRPVWYLWRDGAFWLTTRLAARHTGRDVTEGTAGSGASLSIAPEDRPYRAVLASGPIEVVGRGESLRTPAPPVS